MVDDEGGGAKSQITELTDVNNIQQKKDEAAKLVERLPTRRM
jgi:hypothetical protein